MEDRHPFTGVLHPESLCRPVVEFHQNQVPDCGSQILRQRSLSRPDLDHGIVGTRRDKPDDLPRDIPVTKEILPEGSFGAGSVLAV
jgi:hypothetical protein